MSGDQGNNPVELVALRIMDPLHAIRERTEDIKNETIRIANELLLVRETSERTTAGLVILKDRITPIEILVRNLRNDEDVAAIAGPRLLNIANDLRQVQEGATLTRGRSEATTTIAIELQNRYDRSLGVVDHDDNRDDAAVAPLVAPDVAPDVDPDANQSMIKRKWIDFVVFMKGKGPRRTIFMLDLGEIISLVITMLLRDIILVEKREKTYYGITVALRAVIIAADSIINGKRVFIEHMSSMKLMLTGLIINSSINRKDAGHLTENFNATLHDVIGEDFSKYHQRSKNNGGLKGREYENTLYAMESTKRNDHYKEYEDVMFSRSQCPVPVINQDEIWTNLTQTSQSLICEQEEHVNIDVEVTHGNWQMLLLAFLIIIVLGFLRSKKHSPEMELLPLYHRRV